MINRNQLRIGNILKYEGLGGTKLFMADAGTIGSTEFKQDGEIISHASAVPFDEEWVLRFSRENDYDKEKKVWTIYTQMKIKLFVSYHNGYWYLTDNPEENKGHYLYLIKYVHEIQNIHFSLSGKELVMYDDFV